MADPKGGKIVLIHASNSVKNYSETKTSISFNPDDGSAAIKWNRTDSGQAGLSERLKLRGDSPESRRKDLEEMCGSYGAFEVTRAEAPGLEDLNHGLSLECEGTLTDANFTKQWDRYTFHVNGVWEEAVPELTSTTRVHPVVFDFPRMDQNVVDVEAPPGFETTQPPAVAPLESPYGHYALFISATPSSYHIERVFSLAALAIPVNEYEPLRRFLSQVRQADNTAVEFRKVK
jgi:hypothetical protein